MLGHLIRLPLYIAATPLVVGIIALKACGDWYTYQRPFHANQLAYRAAAGAWVPFMDYWEQYHETSWDEFKYRYQNMADWQRQLKPSRYHTLLDSGKLVKIPLMVHVATQRLAYVYCSDMTSMDDAAYEVVLLVADHYNTEPTPGANPNLRVS